MKDLFGNIMIDQKKLKRGTKGHSENPMVVAYAPYPDSKTKCNDCAYLFYKQYANKYYKCSLRGDTNSMSTDHRRYWPACGKFIKRKTNEITTVYG